MRALWIAVGAAVLVVVGAILLDKDEADQEVRQRIALGKSVYDASCASCHGAELEGQPDWRNPSANGRLPAPPHDETGHTWHHADELLLAIIRSGTAAVVGGGYQSDMPGFDGILTEAESQAALEFIKSTWPQREADYQRNVSNRCSHETGHGERTPWQP